MTPRELLDARPRHREVGAAVLEYVGITLVAAGVVFAVLQTSAGTVLTDAYQRAICTVVEQTDCGSGSGEPSDPPAALRPGDDGYNGQTPLEQATSGDYVALGDSYSSGEGAGDYEEGTDDPWAWGWWADDEQNMCHRSDNSYSGVVHSTFSFDGDYVFGACSGAVMAHYEDPVEEQVGNRDGEGAQRDHVANSDPSLVTMTMGGNDLGFGPVLGSCIKGTCFADPADLQAKKDEIHRLIWGDPNDPSRASLLELWSKVRDDAGGDARILIGGYPQLFPDEPTNGGDSFISVAEQAALNELGAYVNSELSQAIEQSDADVEYVDVSDALEGHEVGTDDPWINDLDLGTGGPLITSQESFHPTEEGQAAMADAFTEQIEQGRR